MQSDSYFYSKLSGTLLGIIAILGINSSSPVAQPVNPTPNHKYELNIQCGTATYSAVLQEIHWIPVTVVMTDIDTSRGSTLSHILVGNTWPSK